MAAEDNKQPAASKTTKVVQYKGVADTREITKAQWAKVGVEDQGKTVWGAKNRHRVKESDLSKSALAFLETQPGFEIVDAEA